VDSSRSRKVILCLTWAIYNDEIEIISLLINHYVDLNANYTVDENTPIFVAAKYGKLEILKMLIEGGAFVDLSNNLTKRAIAWAESAGHMEAVALLYKAGSRK